MKTSPLRYPLLAAWIGLSLALTAGAGRGSVLVSLSFDSGYTAGSSIAGQSGSGDVGVSGAWSSTSYSGDATVSASPSVSYNVSGGGSLGGGNALVFDYPGSTGLVTASTRTLSTALTGQNLFVSLLVDPLTLSGSASADVGFALGAADLKSDMVGIYKKQAGVMVGNGTTFATATSTATLATGTSSLLVAEFVWDSATSSYDQAYFWLNPSATADTSSATLATLSGTGYSSLSSLSLFGANLTSNSSYAFDALTIGTQWADVVPAPEPSALALLAVGLATCAAWRTRRGAFASGA